MTTTIDYALLAAVSYHDTRPDINKFPIPVGWSLFSRVQQDNITGFEASVFQNGTEFVMSFAGTYPNPSDATNPDLQTDFALATGYGAPQLLQAVRYYLNVKASLPVGTNITLTGHSLGGGLAALVGVFFGVSTTTFDQAPFANSAQAPSLLASLNPLNLYFSIPDVAANLKIDLLANGYTETQLEGLTNFLQLRKDNGGIPNSDLINNIRVDGELLSVQIPISMYDTIGSNPTNLLYHAPTSASATDLHSQTLLIAFLQSRQTAAGLKNLESVTYQLTDLLAMIFDKNLYLFDTDKPDENFLERIVRHEFGNAPNVINGVTTGLVTADAMVTRFNTDLWKLAQDGGLTMGNSFDNNVSKALIAFAMQKYYDEKSGSVGVGEMLFNEVSGGVQFDTTAVVGAGNSIASAKGYQQYFQTYLDTTSSLTAQERAIVKALLPQLHDWYVQAGVSGMNATDTLNQGAFMLGGAKADTLTGGAGNNLLVGNAGNDSLTGGEGQDILIGGADNDTLTGGNGQDTLIGGTGNDHLEGGQGFDTYLISTGDGSDTILDTDGLGTVIYNSITLDGGAIVSANRWQDMRGITYRLVSAGAGNKNLLINLGSEVLTIQNFKNDTLGIHLSGDFAPPAFSQSGNGITVTGDMRPYQMPWTYWLWVSNPTWPYVFDGNGNMLRTSLPQGFYPDKIFDSAGDDTINAGDGLNVIYATKGGNNDIWTGLNDDYIIGGDGQDRVHAGGMTDTINAGGGDDIVYGEAGRDVIDGGAGHDYLVGGTGADAIYGGEGDDQIFAGEASLTLEHALVDSGVAGLGQGELLAGGGGDDVVIGDTTNDALLGGTGNDVLAGREGNDILMGDTDVIFIAPSLSEFDAMISATRWPMGPSLNFHSPFSTAPMLNIQFDKIDHGVGSANRFEVKLSSLSNPEAARDNWLIPAVMGGDDQLYGGSGDDWLFGEFGNDILDGGAGNDVLVGGVGDDVMIGGTGNDTYVINAGDGIDRIYDSQANGDINTLVFGVGVDPANIKLFQGSLGLDLGNGSVVHIEGVDYNDIANTSSIQRFEFADGTVLTAQELVARGFDLNGTEGNDTISGTNVVDRIVAGAGDDVLSGGAGNDILNGGAGNDTYLFNIGDGADVILDNGADINTLVFGAGITAAMITPITDANGRVTLDLGNGDRIDLQSADNLAIQTIQFADGSRIATESLLNAPPVAHADALTVYEDGGVVYVPTDALLANDTDPNANDVISVVAVGESALGASVSLNNGQVQYDIGNRFQALGAGQTLTDTFAYTIQDRKGAADSSVVNVTITGVNDAPVTTADDATAVQEDGCITASGNVLANDSDVDQGTVLAVANAGIFTGNYGSLVLNVDGSYTYTLDNASLSVQSLAAGQVVTETFAYQATDGFISTPSTLTVTLTGSNDAPIVAAAIGNMQALEDTPFSFTVPSHTFSDIDQGDTLTYQATLADGRALPSWMRFDAATLTLSGTPNNQDVGVFNIALTATDTGGLTATSQFDFTVQNVNDAPIVVNHLADQYVEKNRRFNIVANGFADWDGIHGDTLTYRATLTNGKPLPSWLKFDAVTHSFSGKTAAAGNWDIVLTASDQSLASVAQIFNLSTEKSDQPTHDSLHPVDTTQDEIFTSSSQNDIIHTGNGADTLIFKRGSGQDTLYGGIGTDNTVALGSGIHLADLSLSKTGNDLILEMGNHDQINLKNWYDSSANYHSLLNLQVVAEATAEFDRTSKDASFNMQNFDFTAIAHAFDVARGNSDTLQHWKMMDSMTTTRLSMGDGEVHSDSVNLSRAFLRDLPQTTTQDVIHTTLFCDQTQNLKSFVGL